MKTLIKTSLYVLVFSIAIITNSTPVYAHQSCDIVLDASVKITPNAIVFIDEGRPLYTIENDQVLVVNNQIIKLSDSQKKLVNQYSLQIRALIPEVKILALNAVSLATDGINLAFNELLGNGNQASTTITTELANISKVIDNKLSLDKEIIINNGSINSAKDGKELLGDNFDEQFEQAVEKAIQASIGSLLIAVGQEMLLSGGDTDAFENKMDDFGDKIEAEMSARTAIIEQQGDKLCSSIIKLDQLEQALQENVSILAELNVLNINHG